jgi:hypothetical protein
VGDGVIVGGLGAFGAEGVYERRCRMADDLIVFAVLENHHDDS